LKLNPLADARGSETQSADTERRPSGLHSGLLILQSIRTFALDRKWGATALVIAVDPLTLM
jgi:hypothetical protein